jgi:DNA mismatch repair protein MutS2
MPQEVVADARARQSGRESLLADHLARVDRELAEIERERQRLSAERQHAAEQHARLLDRESRLSEREAVLKRRAEDRLQERLREARAEVDRVVDALKQKAALLAAEAEARAARGTSLTTGDLGRVRAEARNALAAIADEAASHAVATPPQTLAVGQVVLVAGLKAEGTIQRIAGQYADLNIRGKHMRVPLSALTISASAGSVGTGDPPQPRQPPSRDRATGGPTTQLVVIGSTVEDALSRTEKFLDNAILADERRLRIVHGHGTGRLRQALAEFLAAHPLVAAIGPAPEGEGGRGATIVELKD